MTRSSRSRSHYDPQPFHLDEAAAARSIYGGLLASGWHTGAILMRMMCDTFLHDAASLGSPGVDEIRWLKPVRPGDTLRARFTVVERSPRAASPTGASSAPSRRC